MQHVMSKHIFDAEKTTFRLNLDPGSFGGKSSWKGLWFWDEVPTVGKCLLYYRGSYWCSLIIWIPTSQILTSWTCNNIYRTKHNRSSTWNTSGTLDCEHFAVCGRHPQVSAALGLCCGLSHRDVSPPRRSGGKAGVTSGKGGVAAVQRGPGADHPCLQVVAALKPPVQQISNRYMNVLL